MAAILGEEHAELRSALRRFFTARSDDAAVRTAMTTDSGCDMAMWRLMATQLDLQGIVVPESYGGSGAGLTELAVVMEELGRALACVPFLSSCVLAPALLRHLGDDATARDLLPAIADGSLIATVAWADPASLDSPAGVPLKAARRDGQWRVTGQACYVLDAGVADVLLAVAASPAGIGVFRVRRDAPGVFVSPMAATDPTRRLYQVSMDEVPADLAGADGRAWPAVCATVDIAVTALAAESVGGALCLTEMSAEYAKMRVQFGKAIGSNQAIKHKLADMLAAVELAKAALYAATTAAEDDPERFALEARMAAALCADAYVKASYDAIQIHGGIGFTWEHQAHLYFRRARSSAALLGTSPHHREIAAQRLGLG